MGVHGLWKLIEPSGKPVPLETLENKVLAVDVSIWLHQAIKGFQDSKGAPLPNAHLLGIYHRVCKLLYFKIKPVFVFDGGVPVLKKETIAKRNQLKAKHSNEANKIQKQILNTLLKHTAVNKVLSEQTKSSLPVKYKPGQEIQSDDLFKLPPSEFDSTISSSEDEETTSTSDSSPTKHWDIHTIDEKSSQFRSLPADVRHEILTDLKETRKQSSWGRIHELPTESNEFSGYQMKRLLKRWSIQSSLEETEKEMGGHSLSLGELESLLNDHGVITKESVGNRIASDENTRFLYIKDVKKALEKARVESLKGDGELQTILEVDGDGLEEDVEKNLKEDKLQFKEDLKAVMNILKEDDKLESISEDDGLQEDLEYQRDLNLAIQMSLQDGASTSKEINVGNTIKQTVNNVKKNQTVNNLQIFSAAKSYMIEYSGLTPAGINEIIMGNKCQEEVSDSEHDQSIVSKLFNTEINLDSEQFSDLNENIQDESNIIKTRETNQNKSSDEKEHEDINTTEVEKQKIIEPEVIEIMNDSDSEVSKILNNCEEKKKVKFRIIEQVKIINNSVSYVLEEPPEKKRCESKNDNDNPGSSKILIADNNEENNTKVLVDGLKYNPISASDSNNLNFKSAESKKDSESDSEDDFLEVPMENNVTCDNNLLSDPKDESESDSGDDFLEVPENATAEAKSVLEVVIDVESKMEDDDIFSDIFSSSNEKKTEVKTSFVNLSKLQENVDSQNKDFGVKISPNVEEEIVKPAEAEPSEVSVKNDEKKVEKVKVVPSLSENELRQMERYLENEKESLIVERSNKERLANNITDQMYQEAQELLQLFGVPYIVAPMEAEAQCAFLNEANLTDGTITDDSDIWLFGGKTVYKNFFNQSKHVLQFSAEDIEHHFNLSRLKLIQLSLLVGSDYTVGLQGIGPVTALEILAAFPSYNESAALSYQQVISGLIRFRTWFKKGRIAGPGKTALRTKLRNLEVTESFPSANVARAYLEPEIENSKEQFSWSKPDIVALTDYAKQKFGWTQKKSEEILKPVIKRLQESKAQTTIKDYFKTKHKINLVDLTDKMSKRVKTAVSRMGQDPNAEVQEKVKKPRIKKATSAVRKPRKSKKVDVDTSSNNTLEIDEDLMELQRVEMASTSKVKETEEDIKKQLERNVKRTLHAKDVVHQKERDRSELMKNKLRAIESFRKSKHGPGFMKKRAKVVRKPKDDAELSESTSDDD